MVPLMFSIEGALSRLIFSVFTIPSVYLAGAPTLGCTRQIARPAPRTVHDTDMDRELNRQQIIETACILLSPS